jgi:CRP/FNR family cyclic AMP-dependent transcriptional regulator
MQVTPELLGFFPLLRLLPPDSLADLAQQSTAGKFGRRAVVLESGAEQTHVCFLFEGRLQGVDFTVDGREVGLYFVDPGDFCGELGLFDYGPQPDFVIVLSPAVVVSVPARALRELMAKSTAMTTQLGERLASRLRQMTYQRSLLGMPNIAQRVCCQLWQLMQPHEHDRDNEVMIRNPPTHMEMAIMLNLSRETVTRVFQQLQAREIVKRDGNLRLQISNPRLLKALAAGEEEL